MPIERNPNGAIVNAASLSARDVAHQLVLCPCCERKVYALWPGGWDAHAEYKCEGLSSGTGTGRKAEYKQRFAHLFPLIGFHLDSFRGNGWASAT